MSLERPAPAGARGPRPGPAAAFAQNLWLLAVCAVLQVVLGLLAARSYLAFHNTLANNGRWISTKTTLERGLMGAFAFTTKRQALAHGWLDLSAWHGHQEVLTAETLDPRRLELRFRLPTRSSLCVLFDHVEGQGFAGFRFSNMPRYASTFFVADDQGGFLSRRNLESAAVVANVWHSAAIDFDGRAVTLRLDGHPAGAFPFEHRAVQRIGFRGSERGGLVDDVLVVRRDGSVLRDSFAAPRGAAAITAATPALLVAGNLLLFLLLVRFSRAAGRTLGLHLVLANLSLVGMAALTYGFVVLRSDRYPLVDSTLAAEEAYRRAGEAERVIEEIRDRYPADRPPGTYRILFVGSSQTWGAGAARREEVFAAALERLLEEGTGGATRYECIAGGISGTRAAFLRRVLERHWLPLRPDLVVVNLSSNDAAVKRFVRPLEAMVRSALAAGARVVLVKEANSPEAYDHGLKDRHTAMEAVGDRTGVPVLDMHGHLHSLADTGFLWWDKVHLTSFGQRLMAEKLYAELLPVIRERPIDGAAGPTRETPRSSSREDAGASR